MKLSTEKKEAKDLSQRFVDETGFRLARRRSSTATYLSVKMVAGRDRRESVLVVDLIES